ncbi:MAG: TerC family protein [Deltaproteobacteria bacterium]|nr:TerC family protein [Deltaproteobacteria bacterium]
MIHTVASWWMWLAFTVVVVAMLAVDLGVAQRKAHTVGAREAAVWSAIWVAVSLAFNAFVYAQAGKISGLEFLTGYIIEKALSVDNLFVFFVLFNYFAVPGELQHRVLFWGILGAIVIRGAFIFVGTALISMFHWVIYVLGAFLIVTGVKILFASDEKVEPENNPVLKLARRFLPLTPAYDGQQFLTRRDGRWLATPLLLVLIVIETTDIVFAVDSIPAVLAVTTDPFIVMTSNIFAILGLRALYFLIARIIDRMRYLKLGLGVVLAYVGVKMVITDFVKIPVQISLSIVVGILALSALASVFVRPQR